MSTKLLTKLSSDGQIIIPKAVRQALDLQPGAQFNVRLSGGNILLEPIVDSSIETLYGKFADIDLLSTQEEEHRQELLNDTSASA
ncbi:MAG: AbrB/MazE/SpoVT family DNA-binding domain-containing protein [Anaerolineae bacterium]|nr:AbrB/MazE/SpoVT family DNA-binding domain-containing protein [Anaerolineae bacterium]